MPPENNGHDKSAAEENGKPRFDVPPVETYKTDIVEAIKREKMSAVKIAASQTSWARQKKTLEPVAKGNERGLWRNPLMAAGSILLFLGGIALIAYFAISRLTAPASPVLHNIAQSPIEAMTFDSEKVFVVPADRTLFARVLTAERTTGSLPLSTVNRYILATSTAAGQAPISKDELLLLLAPNADPSLIRAFNEPYAFGFHMLTNKEPFLILSVNSYDYAYAGMLAWESTMADDLAGIFYTAEPAAAGGPPPARTFSDAVIANKDVRVLHGNDGATELMYSFPDQHTLIITTDETTFKNLLNRLQNALLTR